MSDENTTIDSGVNGRTIYNVVVSAGKTYIINAVTGRTEFVVNGEFTPGGDSAVATSLTTAERTAITPDAGVLIWDTDLEKLFIGDGSTAGGVEVQGGGGEGTVTGIEASVDGGTATITATGSTTSVDIVGTGGVDVKGNTTTGVVELNAKDLSDGTQSITKDVKQARFVEYVTYETAATQNALTLLHFSDIHADTAALARIVAAGDALGSLVNDMICTGDLVQVSAGQISSWWNNKVMTVIGNHDSYNGTNWNGLSMADRDSYYIAPFESNWGITHTSGTSYYYKDYSTQKVRLIVLDAMLYMNDTTVTEAAAQTSWLEGLLASAITNNLHVVIALHAPKRFSPVVPCSFSKWGATTVETSAWTCDLSNTIINTVADAKANGLSFVGYICGHLHQDTINDILGDGSQYAYCVTCAAVAQTKQWMPYSDMFRDSTLDAFNLVTIDTAHTTVAIVRGGGANIDEELRPRETISINYGTGEIIDREITKMQDGFRAEFRNGVGSVARYIDTETITGTTVTLQAGHAYTANVNGTVTLNVETPPTSASYGLDGLLDLNLSGGTVQAGDNVYLADTLTANSRNICAVRFIEGIAIVDVITVIGEVPFDGYVVTIASGTSDGSLYYGLATSTETNVGFNASLNGQTVDLGNAVTNGEKNIIGNGFANTIISGDISCTSATTVSNLSLSDVSILGGTMTIQDGNIPADASVTVVGYADLRLVSGSGMFDMTGHASESGAYTGACFTSGGSAYITGATFANATGVRAYYANNTSATLNSCTFTNNTSHAYDCGYGQHGGSALISNCSFTSNVGLSGVPNTFAGAGMHIFNGGIATIVSGYFANNKANSGIGGAFAANIAGTSETTLNDCIFISNESVDGGAVCFYNSGTAYISGCSFSNNSASTDGGAVYARNSATVYITGCSFSLCDCSLGAAVCAHSYGVANISSVFVSGCSSLAGTIRADNGIVNLTGSTITGDRGAYPLIAVGATATMTVSACTVNGNGTQEAGVTSNAFLNIVGDCNIPRLVTANGGILNIAGLNNSITTITNPAGVGTVNISGGATIFLTSSIAPGANRITVSSGGCVVNGATIAAGTYTTIVSSGGSAVAS